jgi:DNA-binding transcriptional LysR family regulator
MDDWNDYRLVLAIARAGSLMGAANRLGVNHSTAYRRLASLEAQLGVRLFERLPAGTYHPTKAGERAAAAAERIETEASALARDIAGRDLRLTGQVRVTSSETLAFRLLTSAIGVFHTLHPGITVELVIDNRVLSLSRREADVALRVTRPREPDLFGRKISPVAWTAYARREIAVNASREPGLLRQLPVIAWEAGARGINAADWLAAEVPEERIVYRTNSVVNQLIAAKAGLGAAVLPCYLGDPEPDLVRLSDPLPELERELWIVTHSDLKRAARIRAFLDVVGERLAAEHALLSGQQAPCGS